MFEFTIPSTPRSISQPGFPQTDVDEGNTIWSASTSRLKLEFKHAVRGAGGEREVSKY